MFPDGFHMFPPPILRAWCDHLWPLSTKYPAVESAILLCGPCSPCPVPGASEILESAAQLRISHKEIPGPHLLSVSILNDRSQENVLRKQNSPSIQTWWTIIYIYDKSSLLKYPCHPSPTIAYSSSGCRIRKIQKVKGSLRPLLALFRSLCPMSPPLAWTEG